MALTQIGEVGALKHIKDYLRGTLATKSDAIETAVDALEANQAVGCTLTVGAEAANVVNVAGQMVDINGTAVAAVQVVHVFISDASTGIGVAATAPDGGVAIGTDGTILVAEVAGKVVLLQTDADGAFDIDVTESGSDAFYTAVVLPNGKMSVSAVMTFTA